MDSQQPTDFLSGSSHQSVRSRRITLYSFVVICILGIIAIAVVMPEGFYKFASIMLIFFAIIYLINLITETFGNSGTTPEKPKDSNKSHRKKKSIARKK